MTTQDLGALSLLAVMFVAYWIPLIIAIYRKHPQQIPIAMINLFVGWTMIGWVVALVWSVTKQAPTTVAPAQH